MRKIRVIPSLLLKNRGLVKTVAFRDPVYLGDPINIVKIFNDKEVDELIFLDINATIEGKKPDLALLSQIASEAFMPFAYGGGIRTVDDCREILSLGVEKVAINSRAVEDPDLVREASGIFGSQSVIVSIDVRKNVWGRYEVCTNGGRMRTKLDPVQHAMRMQEQGAGELFLTSIDRDGTMRGYDLDLIRRVSQAVTIPVVACAGAKEIGDFASAVREGASAVSAGSMFVFQGKHRAVLISYPTQQELKQELG